MGLEVVSVDGRGFSVFVFDNTSGYTLVLFRRILVNNVFALFCFSLFGLYNLLVGLRECTKRLGRGLNMNSSG